MADELTTIGTFETTTERLLAAADLIEAYPERWDQSTWISAEEISDVGWDDDSPVDVQLYGVPKCGTTCCAAGWGVALTPTDVVLPTRWVDAGAKAYGLEDDLAEALFFQTSNNSEMPEILRLIASIPEGQRSLERAKEEHISEYMHY